MKEIGSEFWLNRETKEFDDVKVPQWLNIGIDNKLLLSGRTAIHFVLKDILKNNDKVKTVYFPSYCCQSMLQPFIDLNINIRFYNVKFETELQFDININQECDIFFAMNYFGFTKGRMDRYIEEFKRRNIIVIEDSTHSFLSENRYNPNSDYIIVSLRKWFPIISGGLAVKTFNKFNITPKDSTLKEMIEVKKVAMFQKGKYINNEGIIDKTVFLEKFKLANEMLNKDYKLYSIDKESYQILQNLDIDFIINKRKENSRLLYENLLRKDNFEFLFSKLENSDCPIFVPIIFKCNNQRNGIRKYLIDNNIYCPIHWPKPTIWEENATNIYDYELSLIVDQRYENYDMQYQIRRILEYHE